MFYTKTFNTYLKQFYQWVELNCSEHQQNEEKKEKKKMHIYFYTSLQQHVLTSNPPITERFCLVHNYFRLTFRLVLKELNQQRMLSHQITFRY